MKKRKLLSLGMAALLVISSTFAAFAEEATSAPATGTIEGSGSLEGFVDKDVFVVTLPTTPNADFKIDPQELLLATKGSSNLKLDGSDMVAGYGDDILFIGDGAGNYLSESKNISIVNKSTFAVDVSVGAKLTGLTKANDSDGKGGYTIDVIGKDASFATNTAIKMKLTATLTNGDGTEYVLTDGDGNEIDTTVYLDNSTAGVTNTVKLDATADLTKAYEYKKSEQGVYSYGLKADLSQAKFNTATFNLSGTVNATADWTNFSKDSSADLSVTITYSIAKAGEGTGSGGGEEVTYETAYQVTTSSSTGDTLIGIANVASNGQITTASKIANVKNNDETVAYSHHSTKYCIKIAKANWSAGDVITFEYDGTAYKVTLK